MKKVKASHILVKAEQEAYAVKWEVTDGGKTFEHAAEMVSQCSSAKKGGDLGWFGRGKMVKEFENACFSAQKGDIIGPIKTKFGYHIIRIDDTK